MFSLPLALVWSYVQRSFYFLKHIRVVRDIISGGQQHVFLYTVHTLRLTHIWSSAFFLYQNIDHRRKEKK